MQRTILLQFSWKEMGKIQTRKYFANGVVLHATHATHTTPSNHIGHMTSKNERRS